MLVDAAFALKMGLSNSTKLPPLPQYTLRPAPALIAPIPDKYMSLLMPIVAYWVVSMMFHYIDTHDWFSQYRLHTPAEVLKRNHVSRWEVIRDVIIQQIVQTGVGSSIAFFEPVTFTGMDEYNVAEWAQRVRLWQRIVPSVLAVVGVDAQALAPKVFAYNPSLSGVLVGGQYPWLVETINGVSVTTFSSWEKVAAYAIYWYIIPAIQFAVAIAIVDTWQYFLHRAMHQSKWLYTTFHSRHHRLYVPYAYGALYNHPFEGFLLDSCGAVLAYFVAGMSPRQGMWFFTGSTIKTVDDHCGYALPWDPLQHLTSNNAGYHDVHHQSWGIKTNFSQPFFTFWDRFLGTAWTGGDVSARYERARLAAERKVDADNAASSITSSNALDSVLEPVGPYANDVSEAKLLAQVDGTKLKPAVPAGKATAQAAGSREQVLQDVAGGGASVLEEETAEEEREARRMRTSAGLKGLRGRVSSGSAALHSRTLGVLAYDGGR